METADYNWLLGFARKTNQTWSLFLTVNDFNDDDNFNAIFRQHSNNRVCI